MQSFLPTRALGRLSTFLALAGLVTFTACQPDRGSIVSPGGDATDGDVPDAAFARSDGASGGNPAVWFLPPLVPDPSGDPEFEEEKFNDALDVFIRIFECGASDDDCPATPDDGGTDLGGAATVPNQHYQFNWKTPRNKAGTVYRAFVDVEGLVVGFLDIELTRGARSGPAGGPGAAGSDADDNALVNAGSNAAIKVMIEEGVGPNVTCDVDVTQCQGIVPSSPTVDVLIELEDPDSDTDKNDFTLLIPEGTRFFTPDGEPLDEVTFTLEVCGAGEDLDADIKKVGPCYRVVVTDENGDEVEVDLEDADGDPVEATVSICDLNDPLNEVNPPPVFASGQQGLVSIIHFENGEFAEALQHVDPVGCDVAPPPPVVSASNFLGRFAQVVKDGVVGWLAPERALASSSLLIDTGGGGSLSNFRSGFRGGLMSMLVVPSDEFPTDANGDPQPLQALLGAEVTPSPIVQVVDANDEPVQGATVRFELVDGSGSTISAGDVTTGADGLASVDWTLDALAPDPHELKVFAKGMTAGPEGTGGDNVLQPDAGNTFFGGLNLPGDLDNYGDDFCASNECYGDPEWIVAESFTFEASADANEAFGYGGNGFGFIVPTTGTFPANWNTLDIGDSGGDLGPGPFADANYGSQNTFGCTLSPSGVNSDYTTAWSRAGTGGTVTDPSQWTYAVVQKVFSLPDVVNALRVHVGIDNDVRVAVNGTEITSTATIVAAPAPFGGLHEDRNDSETTGSLTHSTQGIDATAFLRHEACPFLDDIVFDVPSGLIMEGQENVVTVLARDRGGLNFVGVRVTADVGAVIIE